jgi:hypothetical protein
LFFSPRLLISPPTPSSASPIFFPTVAQHKAYRAVVTADSSSASPIFFPTAAQHKAYRAVVTADGGGWRALSAPSSLPVQIRWTSSKPLGGGGGRPLPLRAGSTG